MKSTGKRVLLAMVILAMLLGIAGCAPCEPASGGIQDGCCMNVGTAEYWCQNDDGVWYRPQ